MHILEVFISMSSSPFGPQWDLHTPGCLAGLCGRDSMDPRISSASLSWLPNNTKICALNK